MRVKGRRRGAGAMRVGCPGARQMGFQPLRALDVRANVAASLEMNWSAASTNVPIPLLLPLLLPLSISLFISEALTSVIVLSSSLAAWMLSGHGPCGQSTRPAQEAVRSALAHTMVHMIRMLHMIATSTSDIRNSSPEPRLSTRQVLPNVSHLHPAGSFPGIPTVMAADRNKARAFLPCTVAIVEVAI